MFMAACLSACGGGSASPPAPAWHDVTLSWTANHEMGVNLAGGGYIVTISGQSSVSITVPFESGVAAAPTITTSLYTGSYSASVTAYGKQNGATVTTSAPATMTINVP